MVGGIRYEHSHRLIASTVGFLILVLAVWLWRAEPRQWVRRLGYLALAAVITQGILGGITVLWYLPDPISIAHASLAQIVFCLTTAIALFTSRGWARTGALAADDSMLRKLTVATTAWIYVQILIGATMRHTGAGPAIPDFPLAFGHVIPPHWDAKIAIHFAHRVGALIATRPDPRHDGPRLLPSPPPRRAAAFIDAVAGPACGADHARCTDRAVVERERSLHHQFPARRHRRVRAGDVAGAHAARASCAVRDLTTRPLWGGFRRSQPPSEADPPSRPEQAHAHETWCSCRGCASARVPPAPTPRSRRARCIGSRTSSR